MTAILPVSSDVIIDGEAHYIKSLFTLAFKTPKVILKLLQDSRTYFSSSSI